MRKNLILLLMLLCGSIIHAQIKNTKDTIPRKDSILQDLKYDIQDNIPTISIDDDDMDEGSSAAVSSILTAGKDPFLSAAEFNFSVMRFRLRGYENLGNTIYINGVDMSGLENGFTPFGLWGGLNNVMRSRETTYGLAPNMYNIGSLALNTNIDMRAGAQWAQTQIGYAFSNRTYTHRITFNKGSGFNKKGWAYALALTPRYTNESAVPGTYYRGLSFYGAIDKKINRKNTLSFITFGAPSEMGRSSATVNETRTLTGDNLYNPSWGYQNGKKRNANVLKTFQPVYMLVHELKPSSQSSWMTTVGYLGGDKKTSALDWYNAPDPRPDYYRYLPSYYKNTNPSMANSLTDLYKNNPDALQLNWDKLFDVNQGSFATINNVNGEIGNTVSGKRSLYILSNRVVNQKRGFFNSVYNTTIKNLQVQGGINYVKQVNHYYQEAEDLLGGDFWVNINQFAERDFPSDNNAMQHNIDKPNQIIKQGDAYGYNYKMNMSRGGAWLQGIWKLSKFDIFAGAELSNTAFYRQGFTKNGLFPNQSFGKSKTVSFTNIASKAGITYKLNGRNYFFVNAAYITNAPFFENVYVSQRTRNTSVNDVKSEVVNAIDGGYRYSSPNLKVNIRGYYTTIKNAYDVLTFYHDQYQNFVNYSLSNIDKVHFGTEIGIEAKLTNTFTINGATSIGRYYYDSRQHAIVTVDNSATILTEQEVYLKNYRIPATPQNAYSLGFNYRSPKYWFISLTGNYLSNMWLSPNPLRRTSEAIGDVDPANPDVQVLMNSIIAQEKFKNQFTLDLFGGWSKRLARKYYINNKPTYLVFNISASNLLNDKTITTGGFEQLRFDTENKDINKFPPKYYYGLGANYSFSVAFRF